LLQVFFGLWRLQICSKEEVHTSQLTKVIKATIRWRKEPLKNAESINSMISIWTSAAHRAIHRHRRIVRLGLPSLQNWLKLATAITCCFFFVIAQSSFELEIHLFERWYHEHNATSDADMEIKMSNVDSWQFFFAASLCYCPSAAVFYFLHGHAACYPTFKLLLWACGLLYRSTGAYMRICYSTTLALVPFLDDGCSPLPWIPVLMWGIL